MILDDSFPRFDHGVDAIDIYVDRLRIYSIEIRGIVTNYINFSTFSDIY